MKTFSNYETLRDVSLIRNFRGYHIEMS